VEKEMKEALYDKYNRGFTMGRKHEILVHKVWKWLEEAFKIRNTEKNLKDENNICT